MCSKIAKALLLSALFFALPVARAEAQGHTVGQTFSSLFFLDGKNVVEFQEIGLGLDDLIKLEAYELLPGTVIEVRVTGAGFKTQNEKYLTNERGEAKATLFFPKARTRLTCTIKFTTKNGTAEQIRFYLKPV